MSDKPWSAMSPSEREAYNRLIAAAPELLEALREMVRVSLNSEVNREDYSAAVIAADCAIAKAEGRS